LRRAGDRRRTGRAWRRSRRPRRGARHPRDEDFRLGGRLLAERYEIDGKPALEWVATAEAELASMPDVRIMRRTTVTSVYRSWHNTWRVERVNDHVAVPPEHQPRQRAWKIVAKRAVLAAGALERPIAFGNNDRPGVMLAGAARAYINRYAAAPGQRIAVFTNNDDGWRTAADAHAAGIEIARSSTRAPSRRAIRGARHRKRFTARRSVARAWQARRRGD
jgi:NADPH-dependent 2,4-dienoyl-CoA reductase/sulfur reductase-like enzyme